MTAPAIRSRVKLDWGYLDFDQGVNTHVVVGDLYVPRRIDVSFPGEGEQPALTMCIEVIEGVPTCTRLALEAAPGGRGVWGKDLVAIHLEHWIETFVSACSERILSREGGRIATAMGSALAGDELRSRMATVRTARATTRRKLTPTFLAEVAELYMKNDRGGLGRVQAAFRVSKVTATRYVGRAREAGLIPPREEKK